MLRKPPLQGVLKSQYASSEKVMILARRHSFCGDGDHGILSLSVAITCFATGPMGFVHVDESFDKVELCDISQSFSIKQAERQQLL